jgi:hypothetical protein
MNKKFVDEIYHNGDDDDDDDDENSIPEILEYDDNKVNEEEPVKFDDSSSSIPEEIGIGYYTDLDDAAITDDSSSSIPEDLGYPTDVEDNDARQYVNKKNTTTHTKINMETYDRFKATSAQDVFMKSGDSFTSIPEDLCYPTTIENNDDRQYLNATKSGVKLGVGFKGTNTHDAAMKNEDRFSSIPEDLHFSSNVEDNDDRQYLSPKNSKTITKSITKSDVVFNKNNNINDNNNYNNYNNLLGYKNNDMVIKDINLDDKQSSLESANPDIITSHSFYNNPPPPKMPQNLSFLLEDIENILSFEKIDKEFENYSARAKDNSTSLPGDNDNDNA